MSNTDRFFRALFVALGVGLGWGIRGDFGHVLGAMYPGAILGMGFCYVSGQRSLFRLMPLMAGLSAILIGMGGMMSYGILHGYAKASGTWENSTFGLFMLFLQGAAWGVFACAALGLVMEDKRLTLWELGGLLSTVVFSGFVAWLIVCVAIGFDVNPPRSNLSVGYTGGAIGLFAWLARNNKRYALRGAFFGYIGFGFAMYFGRFLANCFTHLPDTWHINDWNVGEVSAGFFGALIFTFAMLGKKVEEPEPDRNLSLLHYYAIFYTLAFIPLFHRLLRLDAAEMIPEWTRRLEEFGYSQSGAPPATFLEHFSMDVSAYTVLNSINIIVPFAFLLALAWFLAWRKDEFRYAYFPAMALSLTMLLFQNLRALYFWFRNTNEAIVVYLNMHTVFWILFIGMALYVIVRKFIPHTESIKPNEELERVQWAPWIGATVMVFIAVAGFTFLVNHEKTQSSANERWPLWSWRVDGDSRALMTRYAEQIQPGMTLEDARKSFDALENKSEDADQLLFWRDADETGVADTLWIESTPEAKGRHWVLVLRAPEGKLSAILFRTGANKDDPPAGAPEDRA